MNNTLEVIYDANPKGCGCNCGCGGASKAEDMDNLIEEIKTYDFKKDLSVDVLAISELEPKLQIDKINTLLDNTNAQFRADEENIEEVMDNILPLIVLDGKILTAYGIPTLYDVVFNVDKNLQ